jgi:hypothetical protein
LEERIAVSFGWVMRLTDPRPFQIVVPPGLSDGSNQLVVFAKSLKVANSPGALSGSAPVHSSRTGPDSLAQRPVVMEYFTVNCESVAASFTAVQGGQPTPILTGMPGQFLRVNFGSPLNLMEKCAARVQMQVFHVVDEF